MLVRFPVGFMLGVLVAFAVGVTWAPDPAKDYHVLQFLFVVTGGLLGLVAIEAVRNTAYRWGAEKFYRNWGGISGIMQQYIKSRLVARADEVFVASQRSIAIQHVEHNQLGVMKDQDHDVRHAAIEAAKNEATSQFRTLEVSWLKLYDASQFAAQYCVFIGGRDWKMWSEKYKSQPLFTRDHKSG